MIRTITFPFSEEKTLIEILYRKGQYRVDWSSIIEESVRLAESHWISIASIVWIRRTPNWIWPFNFSLSLLRLPYEWYHTRRVCLSTMPLYGHNTTIPPKFIDAAQWICRNSEVDNLESERKLCASPSSVRSQTVRFSYGSMATPVISNSIEPFDSQHHRAVHGIRGYCVNKIHCQTRGHLF